MIRWPFVVLAVAILAAPNLAAAQGANAANPYPPRLPNPANPDATAPTRNYGTNPANYGAGGSVPNAGASYGSNPANYVSTHESARREATPQQREAERQSGLSEAQAKTLLEEKGYRRILGVAAAPNSLWVWQADVLKDGRPTRVGIDYRGNVLDLSRAQARPCTVPGVQLGGVGGLPVGSRLSQSDACSSR
jgi:hypothetical protein